MKNIIKLSVILLSTLGLASFSLKCMNSGKEKKEVQDDYWYQGKAEITSFKLEQARYGEIHEGHAVMIFVTEDFSKSKHVKLDHPSKAKEDAAKVLKLNFTRKFNTGIYPYSTMVSVFTPVEMEKLPNSLKVTTTSQEWCGHVFMQMNYLDNDKYKVQRFSYFESEGDKEFKIENALLEDEIWNKIRLQPGKLPTGTIKIIPSTLDARLKHYELEVQEAIASLKEKGEDYIYTIDYADLNRKLSITFKKEFPYKIMEWEEEIISGFGKEARKMTTKATREKTLFIDYWNKNSTDDIFLKEKLNLE